MWRKEKIMKKRLLAVLLVLCMSITTLTACGDNSKNTDNTQEEGSVSTQEKDSASSDTAKKEKITIALQTDSFITDYEDNYLTNLLEEEMGVEIEIYQLPTDTNEMKTKLSLMISGSDKLPDVFCIYGIGEELILDYGSKGAFIPLNDYLNDPELAVNFNDIPQEDKDTIITAMTSADGNIYALPKFEPQNWNLTPNRLYLNETWLNNLGLDIPATTEEYREVLRAFVNEDPNGNGIKDEIGVYGIASGGYGENVTLSLMNAFEFYRGGGELALSEDGSTVIAPYTTEGWKKGLEYMNSLYTEGLLEASIFTDDSTQFKATLNNESANIVGSVSAGSYGNWTDTNNNKNFQDMVLIAPLEGPDGIAYTPYLSYNPDPTWYITSSCENPELAFQLGDLFFRQDMGMTARYGEEGVDWTMDEEILGDYTNEYIELGLYDQVSAVDLTNLWAENTNKFWHNINPRYAPTSLSDTIALGTSEYDPDLATVGLKVFNDKYYIPAHPEHVLEGLKFTIEESKKITEVATNIPEFIKQSLAEFVTGARSLDDWDQYLKELDNMGIETWIECTQAAYDRIK